VLGSTVTTDVTPPTTSADAKIVLAAGNIACDPEHLYFRDGAGAANNCHQQATADLIAIQRPDAVLPLGDIQYESADLADFILSFDRAWGPMKPLMHPIAGNHEYDVPGAPGYFAYFGAAAGPPDRGYYSFDVGTWHLIALNSNCSKIAGGCDRNGAQATWLRADLAAHENVCTLAYWHHPRFSSGRYGNDARTDRLWRALYDGGADVVLTAHNHNYERFAPLDPNGHVDRARGIREFVVGTGGRSHDRFRTIAPNSEVRDADTFGVLRLRLGAGAYSWQFVPEAKGTFTDAGSDRCH
jgi:hypothetical protein